MYKFGYAFESDVLTLSLIIFIPRIQIASILDWDPPLP